MRHLKYSLVVLFGVVLAGCTNQPALTEISGTVTFKGQPIPAGDVSFTPDATIPGGQLRMYFVTDGKYNSADQAGTGLLPGKYKVRINGYDGKKIPMYYSGKQIFNPYELDAEISPGKSATLDFTVPESLGENIKYTETADF